MVFNKSIRSKEKKINLYDKTELEREKDQVLPTCVNGD